MADLTIQRLNNYVQTKLAAGCTNVATDLALVSVAGLPTVGNFMLRIDDTDPATTFEYVECTAVNVGTGHVTVTRAQEGTTGVAHNAGAFVGNDITAAMLGRVSGQQIRSRAYCAAAQSIPSAVATKILLDTSSFDLTASFDLVTNHRWVCPFAGYYQISLGAMLQTGAGGRFRTDVYKNGALLFFGSESKATVAGDFPCSTGTDVALLAATDFIEIFAFHTMGVNEPLIASTGQANFLTIAFEGQ